MGVSSGDDRAAREVCGCAAERMWRNACNTLVAPNADAAWNEVVEASPPENTWHSLRNCVAYQAGVWQNMLLKGIDDVMHPAAFKAAVVLRHTPSDIGIKILSESLPAHPQSQDLSNYILALLTDDEAWCGSCGTASITPATQEAMGIGSPPAPVRDLQLFGDLELAVLAGSREEYDAHAKLVRAEYSQMSQMNYVELRIKVLTQLIQIPKLYHTQEFECFEVAARDNIEREICTLREHLQSEEEQK